jgi:hypothetical protein
MKKIQMQAKQKREERRMMVSWCCQKLYDLMMFQLF